MNETWAHYLARIGVTTEQGVEMCHQCKKAMGEVQMYGGIGGKLVPCWKMCWACNVTWKKYAKLVVR